MAECKTCSGPIKGFKCDECGATASKHDPDHECGGDHCMPMCAGCEEAEELCMC